MNLRTLAAALRRRWYLLLVGLLATAGMVVAAVMVVPPTYTATSSTLLLPPKSTIGQRGNPYLNLGGLGPAVDVLSKRLTASPPAEAIMEANPDADISAEPDITSSGPILLVTVEAQSAQAALELRDAMTQLVEPTLDEMQSEMSIGNASRITTSVLASDKKPEVSYRAPLRIVIVAAAGGLLVTGLGTAAIDGLLIRRRRRKASPEQESTTVESDAPQQDDEVDWWASEAEQQMLTEEAPALVEETPDAIGEAPAVVEETPDDIEESPAALEKPDAATTRR